MNKFNMNNRILMFAICSSIEFDLRKFLSSNNEYIALPSEMFKKAKDRNNNLLNIENKSNNENLLIELDMGDLVSIICKGAPLFGIGISEVKIISKIFEKIIPIRNKVMHTRPIEFSDRGILEETLYSIDTSISCINWNELIKIRKQFIENPQKLIIETTFKPELDNSTKIYHNLPVPEFDDTGYIGRKKEIKDLMKLLESDKNQIITVVGNGGIGKTAIVVKCLYDLIDGLNPYNFEAIIWVSLKTRTLSKGEFININSSILRVNEMYNALHKKVVIESFDAEKDILNFMNEFKTLLVIDNLETIPTEEIINFLKSIPSKSKVLITSRSGIGELENRYSLKEMNKEDARLYFISLSKYYQLNLHEKEKNELDDFIKSQLYSSPLSIKWYITSIFFGADPIKIISDKNNLVEFSMSNIIEKLSNHEIIILWLLLLEGKSLTYGEIDFYLNPDEPQNLILSINKLIATSMLNASSNGKYEINNMAKDYLKKYRTPNINFIRDISEKRNMLNSILQQIKTKNEADPYNPKSLFNNLKNENTKIASYYLSKALEYSSKKNWDQSYSMIKKAENIAPDYFEVYKIRAFINAESNNLMDAIESYRIALENANTSDELASIHYLFSIFYTLKLKDYILAKEHIEKAEEYNADEPRIVLEKGRVYMYLGEFDKALEIFKSIDLSKNKTDKFLNQYVSKIADLYKRMARNYDTRDFEIKYQYIEKGINEIDALKNIDQTTCVILIQLLTDLTYLFLNKKAKDLFIKIFKKHINIIQNNTSSYSKKLGAEIINNELILQNEIVSYARTLSNSFKEKSKLETNLNKGYIIKLSTPFGFIQNASGSYYFKIYNINYANPQVGDYVYFKIKEYERGYVAYNISLILKYKNVK